MMGEAFKQGLLTGLFISVVILGGKGLVYLAYGKKGMAARSYLGMDRKHLDILWCFLLAILLLVALFYFLFRALDDAASILLVPLIIIPAAYILWVVFARLSVPGLLREVEKKREVLRLQEERKRQEMEEIARLRRQQEEEQRRQAEILRQEAEKKREEALAGALERLGHAGDVLRSFLVQAETSCCVKDIAALWEDCDKEGMDPKILEGFRKCIGESAKVEHANGVYMKRTKDLVKTLKDIISAQR